MDRAIVSVKKDGDVEAHDLEVPTGMPVRQLALIISRALGWALDPQGRPVHFDVGAQPPGRILNDEETLAQVGAWDGSWLIFYKKQLMPAQTEGPMKGLAGTWKSIEATDIKDDISDDHTSVNIPWKQLDD